jgi:hypothetical protein
MRTVKTIVLNFSGMGFNHISRENTPNICSLNNAIPLKQINLYPDGGLYFGTAPKDHSIVFRVKYAPDTSPFKPLRAYASLLNVPDRILPYFPRKVYRMIVGEIISRISGDNYFNPELIPFNLLHLFDWSFPEAIKKNQKNLFTLLEENKIRHNGFISRDKDPFIKRLKKRYTAISDQYSTVLKELENNNCDFYYRGLVRIDNVSHKYGPHSREALNEVKRIDSFISSVVKVLSNKHERYNLVLMSSTGQMDVKQSVNVMADIKGRFDVNKADYFLDSTAARFWVKGGEDKIKLTEALSSLGYGYVLSDGEYDDFMLPRDDKAKRRYGDIIFVVDPGYLLLPNFWQGKFFDKGMHGYCSKSRINDLEGFFWVYSNYQNRKNEYVTKMVEEMDITPTLLNLLKVEVPDTMTGRVVVKV